MKIALVADVHCANHKVMGGPVEAGLNRRCRQVLAALERAVARARDLDCAAFFVAGDLLDTTRPEPQVITAIQAVLVKARDPHLLVGNHELVSEQNGDHALGPFAPVATVVSAPAWKRAVHEGVEVLCVPFQPGDAREWLPKVVAEQCKGRGAMKHRILLLHMGLEDERTPTHLKGSHESIPSEQVGQLCKNHGFEAAFSGDWHLHRVMGASNLPVVQIGTLAPTGFDNPGLDELHGSLLVWDTEQQSLTREVIPGPRFIELRDGDRVPKLGDGYYLYAKIIASPSGVVEAVETLKWFIEAKDLAGGEVVPDDTESRAAARTAATVARSAQTMEEAVAGFVGQMPLPEGVRREEVLAKVKHYLGG